MADPFVGRTAELEVLASEWARACASEARVVLLVGEAGIGKSALVRRFVADQSKAVVLRADGDEAETALAFGTLERLLGGLDAPLSRQLSAIVRGGDPVATPTTVGAALVGLLGDLQDGRTLLLLVDDAHWVDSSSLAALTFALRRLRADRVLTLVTTRSDLPAALPAGLTRLVDDGGGTRLSLGGIGLSDLQSLGSIVTGEPLSGRAARRLHDHTMGSPLHALALLRELGPRRLEGRTLLPAPSSFAALVLDRLASCASSTQRLIAAASVLGIRCGLPTAARLAGNDGDPLGAVDEAIAAGLLAVERDGVEHRLLFPHPLVRAAIYESLGMARRAALHAAAAELLDGDAALAHRVAGAARDDPALAAALVARAGSAAARGAWGEGGAYLVSAAQLDSARRSERLIGAARLMLAGLDVAGIAPWRNDIAAGPDTPDRDYVLGHLEILAGQPVAAGVLLERALSGCEDGDHDELAASIACQLAFIAINDSKGAEGMRWAGAALQRSAPSSPLAGYARSMLGASLVISGHAPEARALAWPDPLGEVNGGPRTEELFGRGLVNLWTDRLAEARRDLGPVAGIVASGNLTPATFQALIYLAEAELRSGAWDDALVHGDLAISLAVDTGAPGGLALFHAVVATVRGLRGSWDLADLHAAEAMRAAQHVGQSASLAYAHLAAAHIALARGSPAGVLAAVGPLLAMRELDGVCEPGVIPWQDLHAEALVRLGRHDEAAAVLSGLEARAAERTLGSGIAAAARVRGDLAAARSDRATAMAAFEAGLACAEPLEMPFLTARLNLAFGAFLRRYGSRRAAVAQLEAARDRFTRLGAEPFVARCDRELTGCGLHPAGRGHHRIELTPQELAVSHLLARGMSNREIAAELIVSPRTVEYHLGNIFVKLGITSRAQLAMQMAAGTTEPPAAGWRT